MAKIKGVKPRCLEGKPEPKMLTIRLPPGLYTRIARICKGSSSMNQFAVDILEGAVSLIEKKAQDEKDDPNPYTAVADVRRPEYIDRNHKLQPSSSFDEEGFRQTLREG